MTHSSTRELLYSSKKEKKKGTAAEQPGVGDDLQRQTKMLRQPGPTNQKKSLQGNEDRLFSTSKKLEFDNSCHKKAIPSMNATLSQSLLPWEWKGGGGGGFHFRYCTEGQTVLTSLTNSKNRTHNNAFIFSTEKKSTFNKNKQPTKTTGRHRMAEFRIPRTNCLETHFFSYQNTSVRIFLNK